MSLSRRIREYRYSKGWGPDELAHRAEISRTALYQIESGKTDLPRAATLRRIAEALEVPIEALLDRDVYQAFAVAPAASPAGPPLVPSESAPSPSLARTRSLALDLDRKILDVLESPLGDHFARIVDELHRFVRSSYLTQPTKPERSTK